jgi:2-oxoglutarate ferredoxin oxidoreductase subunit beta
MSQIRKQQSNHPLDGLLRTDRIPHIWCPGCCIGTAFSSCLIALKESGIDLKKTVMVSGIGCTGRGAGYANLDSYHTTHGRPIPFATGMKLANPELNIFAVGGDGDGLGIGGGHVPHVARKNVDMVYILLDNSIYGLTKGQSSPTSPLDMTSKTAPYAYLEDPLNPLAMFLAYGVSFIARGFSGKPKDLKALFSQAIQHKGFSVVHIFSPCVTMNKQITFKTMNEIVKPLPEDWDTSDRVSCFAKALDTSTFWTGVFYRDQRPTMSERLEKLPERSGRYEHLSELLEKYA